MKSTPTVKVKPTFKPLNIEAGDLDRVRRAAVIGRGGVDYRVPDSVGFATSYAVAMFADKYYAGDSSGYTGGGGLFLWSKITEYKDIFVYKYQYEGFTDENSSIPDGVIESVLFMYGRGVLFKYKGKFQFTSFTTAARDKYNRALEVVPIWPNGGNKTNPWKESNLHVGKDSVIIYNDNSHIGSTAVAYGTLVELWPYFSALTSAYNNLIRNQYLSRSFLKVPSRWPDKSIRHLENSIIDGNLVLKMDSSPMRLGSFADKDENQFDFKDKTPSYWYDYHSIDNLLKSRAGLDSNADPSKKERQVRSEIDVNNSSSDALSEGKLSSRKKALEKANLIWKDSTLTVDTPEREPTYDDQENKHSKDNVSYNGV